MHSIYEQTLYSHFSLPFHYRDNIKAYVFDTKNMEDVMENFLQVTVYNQRLSVTKIEEVPAYTLFNLFSDIGVYCADFYDFNNIRVSL